ncbi:amino acid--tRNA ligase-related protein [Candidatus Hodgkinia cicadicola]
MAIKPNSYTSDLVLVSARVLAVRNDRFIMVSDYTGASLQLHVCEGFAFRKSVMLLRLLKVGDLVRAFGFVYKDKQNNVSVLVKELVFVSKGDQDKWAIYENKRARARALVFKSNVVRELRRRLLRLGYVELETPALHAIEPASVKPFITRYDWRKLLLQLRVSPEFYLKNYMCVSECRGVFEFAKSFRNEGESALHSREFSLLELYCFDLSWSDCLNWVKTLFLQLCLLFNRPQPKQRLVSCCELIREQTGYRFELIGANDVLRLVRLFKLNIQCLCWAKALLALFERLVVNTCELLYVLWYPVQCSLFSRAKWHGSRFACRFEVYWNGVELVNACLEINSYLEQLKRCNAQVSATLLESLSYGFGNVFGLGLGIDRLVMLLFNKPLISTISMAI